MRKSKILRRIRMGETAVTTKLNLADPRGAEIAAMFDFDGLWIDLEHVPGTIHDVERIVWAAKCHDCDVITRVEKIVYYTKFHPIGRRPIDGGNADGGYCLIEAAEYMKEANTERIVIVQIEDPEPLEDLEKIAALDGIDMLFFGPADFTQGIGCPLDFANYKVTETRKRVAEVAKKYGKLAGTTGSPESFEELKAMGYNLINICADVVALGKAYKEALDKIGR